MPTVPVLTGAQIVNNPGFDLEAIRAEAQRAPTQATYPLSTSILDAAVAMFRVRTPYYDKCQRYYDGDHPIIIASYDKRNIAVFKWVRPHPAGRAFKGLRLHQKSQPARFSPPDAGAPT